MATETKGKRGNGLVFTFEHDGAIKVAAAGVGEHRFHPREASLECNHFAALKGWKSTFEDAAAKSRNPDTGLPAPLADRFAASVAIMKHYADKDVVTWGRKATGGAREGADTGLIVMALTRIWERDVAGVELALGKLATKAGVTRDAKLKELAKAKDVVRVVGEIKAERAAASSVVSAANMLAELDELDDEDVGKGGGDEPGPADNEAPF